MMPCYCPPLRRPAPICCCSWPPKPHPCYCQQSSSIPNLISCDNNVPNCPCSTFSCRTRQPPLRAMQKALVDKWTEVEKLGQLAHMYWCQHRALQHQLACMQAKYCRLRKQDYPDLEQQDFNGIARCRPENPAVYQGVLKIRDRESIPNQLCICNSPEPVQTCRGVVRVHEQDDDRQEVPCRALPYGLNYGSETEKLRTECEMKELNLRLKDVNRSEEQVHERLQRLREELECLQTKIKSNWGQNALDKCTPAKENQTRFF